MRHRLSRTRRQVESEGHCCRIGTLASGARACVGAKLNVEAHYKIARPAMNIAYYHASKFGNGAMVAEEFKKIMAAKV